MRKQTSTSVWKFHKKRKRRESFISFLIKNKFVKAFQVKIMLEIHKRSFFFSSFCFVSISKMFVVFIKTFVVFNWKFNFEKRKSLKSFKNSFKALQQVTSFWLPTFECQFASSLNWIKHKLKSSKLSSINKICEKWFLKKSAELLNLCG